MALIIDSTGSDFPIQGDSDDPGAGQSVDQAAAPAHQATCDIGDPGRSISFSACGTNDPVHFLHPAAGDDALQTRGLFSEFRESASQILQSQEAPQENVAYDACGHTPESNEIIYQQGGDDLTGIVRDKLISGLPGPASSETKGNPQASTGDAPAHAPSDKPAFNSHGNAQLQWVEEFHDIDEEGRSPQQSASYELLRSKTKHDGADQVAGNEEAGLQEQEAYEHLRQNIDYDARGQNPEAAEAGFQPDGDALSEVIRDRLLPNIHGSAAGGLEVWLPEQAGKQPDAPPQENRDFNSQGNAQVRREEQFNTMEGADSEDDDD